MDFKTGRVVINGDPAALKSIKYLNYNQNVVYYIEHLHLGTDLKEIVPDYCKPDNEVENPNANERESDLHILNGCTRLDAKKLRLMKNYAHQRKRQLM